MNGWYFRFVLVVAAVGWGLATTATKFALGGFGPMTMLVVKLAAATIVLWAVLLIRGRAAPSERPARDRLRFALLGLFEPALAYGGLTLGLTFTTAANASLLGVTESIFVLVLAAIFLGERIGGRGLLGLLLAVAGVLALGGHDLLGGGVGFAVGDLIVVAGSVAAAVYVTLAAKVAPTVDPLTMTTYQFTYGTLFVAPLGLWSWLTGREPFPTAVAPQFWLAAIFVGGVCFALSFLLYNSAIRHVPAGMAGLILNMVPVIGVLSAVVLLSETLTVWHIVGSALVVVGIVLFPATKDEPSVETTGPAGTPLPAAAGRR
ncbi:DMT family transporter [Pseudonocardia sp. TRM90224]|uniref:DMT family transporter n=1 Tax=Pseudonocardia sp. TRM90224 TaxID=2812678 RepID=UPI001E620E7D|nr:DMT family transporter [Pseudonocardia sp. TRM90224]